MDTYYKPSGKFSVISFLYFFLLSITAFPLLGLIYAYCIWYIPFFYINFLIAAAFGFLIGFLINTVVIGKGKVRNVPLSLIFGLLGGFVALYFHWAVWVDLVINAGESYGNSTIGVTASNIEFLQVFNLAIQPDLLFEIIGEINKTGTWGLKGTTVSGAVLSVIWIIELLIIVVVTIITSFHKSKQPFCEKDNSWFKETVLGTFDFILDTASVTKELETGNSTLIETINKIENPQISHSILTMYTSNFKETYLSIENKNAKTDKDGKLDFDDDPFLDYISINSTLKQTLLDKKIISEN